MLTIHGCYLGERLASVTTSDSQTFPQHTLSNAVINLVRVEVLSVVEALEENVLPCHRQVGLYPVMEGERYGETRV